MVLKVVTGKILETLKLRALKVPCAPISGVASRTRLDFRLAVVGTQRLEPFKKLLPGSDCQGSIVIL
jgi:hypothetical protein